MSLGGVLKVFGRSKKDIGDRFKACKKLSIRVTYFIRFDGSKILKSDHKTIVFKHQPAWLDASSWGN